MTSDNFTAIQQLYNLFVTVVQLTQKKSGGTVNSYKLLFCKSTLEMIGPMIMQLMAQEVALGLEGAKDDKEQFIIKGTHLVTNLLQRKIIEAVAKISIISKFNSEPFLALFLNSEVDSGWSSSMQYMSATFGLNWKNEVGDPRCNFLREELTTRNVQFEENKKQLSEEERTAIKKLREDTIPLCKYAFKFANETEATILALLPTYASTSQLVHFSYENLQTTDSDRGFLSRSLNFIGSGVAAILKRILELLSISIPQNLQTQFESWVPAVSPSLAWSRREYKPGQTVSVQMEQQKAFPAKVVKCSKNEFGFTIVQLDFTDSGAPQFQGKDIKLDWVPVVFIKDY